MSTHPTLAQFAASIGADVIPDRDNPGSFAIQLRDPGADGVARVRHYRANPQWLAAIASGHAHNLTC